MDHHQSSLSQSLIVRVLRAAGLAGSVAFFWSGPAHAIDSIQWSGEFGLSFPQPVTLGVEASCQGTEGFCKENLKFFGNIGVFKLPLADGSRSFSIFSAELGTRYFPFSFPLYFSGALGYRFVTFTTSLSSFTI